MTGVQTCALPISVLFDCVVDKVENCFPMIPSGKAHNEMILNPEDEKENKITKAGKVLV